MSKQTGMSLKAAVDYYLPPDASTTGLPHLNRLLAVNHTFGKAGPKASGVARDLVSCL
jgi:hypothetical protein